MQAALPGTLVCLILAILMLAQGYPLLLRPRETLRWLRGLPSAARFFLRNNPQTMTAEEAYWGGVICVVAGYFCIALAIAVFFGKSYGVLR